MVLSTRGVEFVAKLIGQADLQRRLETTNFRLLVVSGRQTSQEIRQVSATIFCVTGHERPTHAIWSYAPRSFRQKGSDMPTMSRHQPPTKVTLLVPIATVMAAAVGAVPVTAHADAGAFQSPSGNIVCSMGTFVDGKANDNFVACEITDHSWVAPPRAPDCALNWGNRFRLEQGSAAVFACQHQAMPAPQQTLDYGQTRSVGAITCDSEPAAMTCTDSSTGHFFRVSRDSYQLG